MTNYESKYQLTKWLLWMTLAGILTYSLIRMINPDKPIVKEIIIKDTLNLDNFNEKNLNIMMNLLEIQYPEIVLSQAKLETGNFTSNVFKEYNNLFGFMKGKKYYKYDNWRESVLHYAHWQNINYSGGDYYKFLVKIHYASDTNYIPKLKKICLKLK